MSSTTKQTVDRENKNRETFSPLHSSPHEGAESQVRGAEPQPPGRYSANSALRVVADFVLAVVLLPPALVLIAILVVLVRLTSRGPGIYRQARVGKDGKRFTMYKIRTMAVDAESQSGPVWTQPSDLRVTSLGRVLRKLHLDELPQIFNVLCGQMSFVGPRPERPEFVRVLSEVVPNYRERLAVRPGITGLAQINLPPDSDLMSVRRKLALDLDYIENNSVWLDLRLVFCTVCRVIKIHEGLLTRVLRLERDKILAAIEATAEATFSPLQATPEAILVQAVQGDAPTLTDSEENAVRSDQLIGKPR
jgi:lipopolysaccharide/colanic/teichoic acid biosynthesis glycosyltransferase